MSDTDTLTLSAIAEILGTNQSNASEIVGAFIERAQKMNGRLGAYVTILEAEALEAARISSYSESARNGTEGSLRGAPIAVKDVFATAGVPTTACSVSLINYIPDEDAEVVRKLRKAGAIVIGKSTTSEFACGPLTPASAFPITRNPWDDRRSPSGSSSGSAVAVAAGMCAGAVGSDAGGSIRLPAAHCGVAGLKPTFGRVSRRGAIPLSFSLDTVGPIAWTVRDCALLLQAIAGHDASDPASISEPVPDYTATLSTDLAGVRIGHVRQFYREDAADDVIEGIEAAIKVMADLGAVVSEVELPQLSLYNACTRVLVQSEAYAIHSSRLRQNETGYNSVTRARLMLGATISAEEYINCQRLRRKLLDRTVAAMDEVDVLVTAIQYEAPIFISEDSIYPYFGKPALATPFNVTGQPALAICCGFGKEGMPLSLQIAGRHFEEALVLKVGYAYESATPWRERRPVFTEQRRAQRISGREP